MINDETVFIDNKVKIKEIFASIQGEGPYMGTKQLFIRFCDCNLRCRYCDTEFSGEAELYSPEELAEVVKKFGLKTIHSISLTGGEPLLSVDFLEKFLPILKNNYLKVYLETNATLPKELERIINYVDYVSADIKLYSATGMMNMFETHDKFFAISKKVEHFAKVVFDSNITEEEIENCISLAKKYDIPLILQPKMDGDNMSVTSVFAVETMEKFLKKYPNVRLIPQVHKFLAVR